jgi:hypothetical protein
MVCTAQGYIGGKLGLTFTKDYSPRKKVETFAPRSFLFAMPAGYAFSHWLFETEIGCNAIPYINGQVGYSLNRVEFLSGINDLLYVNLKGKWQMIQQFAPVGTVRLFFSQEFFVEFSGTKGFVNMSIGGKGFLRE